MKNAASAPDRRAPGADEERRCGIWAIARRLTPGAALAGVVAIASAALAERYAAPATVFALLLGLSLSFLSEDPAARPGLEFVAANVLKGAIALLGLTIPFSALTAIGLGPLVCIAGATLGVVLLGCVLGSRFGWGRESALVASGAAAICGASAALALAALVSPGRHPPSRSMAIIFCVTALSSAGMMLYPVLLGALGLSDVQSGFVIGLSIHDVGQTVAAGYAVSEPAGETATLVKMTRVALLPAVMSLALIWLAGSRQAGAPAGGVSLPWFVVAFGLGMAVAGVAPPPDAVAEAIGLLSQGAILLSIGAIGLLSKTSEIARSGLGALKFLTFLSAILFAAALSVAFALDVGPAAP